MIVTSLLVRWEKGWSEVTRPDAVTVHGRKEAMLALGAVQSREEMTATAGQQLAVFGDPRTEIGVDLAPVDNTDTPYVAFGVGDRVFVPDLPGLEPVAERVMAITVTMDSNGELTYAPELKDVLLDDRERAENALGKMANGTLGGDSTVATPATFVTNLAAAAKSITAMTDCCDDTWTITFTGTSPDGYSSYASVDLPDVTTLRLLSVTGDFTFPAGDAAWVDVGLTWATTPGYPSGTLLNERWGEGEYMAGGGHPDRTEIRNLAGHVTLDNTQWGPYPFDSTYGDIPTSNGTPRSAQPLHNLPATFGWYDSAEGGHPPLVVWADPQSDLPDPWTGTVVFTFAAPGTDIVVPFT